MKKKKVIRAKCETQLNPKQIADIKKEEKQTNQYRLSKYWSKKNVNVTQRAKRI